MVNARNDFFFPLETSQVPRFKLIGAREKRHALVEGGHVAARKDEAIKEILDWLDRYLGTVRLR